MGWAGLGLGELGMLGKGSGKLHSELGMLGKGSGKLHSSQTQPAQAAPPFTTGSVDIEFHIAEVRVADVNHEELLPSRHIALDLKRVVVTEATSHLNPRQIYMSKRSMILETSHVNVARGLNSQPWGGELRRDGGGWPVGTRKSCLENVCPQWLSRRVGMAVAKQLQAVQGFLRGIRALSTYEETRERQLQQMERSLRCMAGLTTAQAGAWMESLEESLWSAAQLKAMKELLVEKTGEKVEESGKLAGEQDYTALPHLLSEEPYTLRAVLRGRARVLALAAALADMPDRGRELAWCVGGHGSHQSHGAGSAGIGVHSRSRVLKNAAGRVDVEMTAVDAGQKRPACIWRRH